MSKEVLQEALELLAVATFITPKLQAKRTEVIKAGLQALDRLAQQEPFAWANKDDICAETAFRWCEIGYHKTPLYTFPPAQHTPPSTFTTGHCKEKAKEGGCQLHNIQCGFPACDRKEL